MTIRKLRKWSTWIIRVLHRSKVVIQLSSLNNRHLREGVLLTQSILLWSSRGRWLGAKAKEAGWILSLPNQANQSFCSLRFPLLKPTMKSTNLEDTKIIFSTPKAYRRLKTLYRMKILVNYCTNLGQDWSNLHHIVFCSKKSLIMLSTRPLAGYLRREVLLWALTWILKGAVCIKVRVLWPSNRWERRVKML